MKRLTEEIQELKRVNSKMMNELEAVATSPLELSRYAVTSVIGGRTLVVVKGFVFFSLCVGRRPLWLTDYEQREMLHKPQ